MYSLITKYKTHNSSTCMTHNSVLCLCVEVGQIWKSVPHKTALITCVTDVFSVQIRRHIWTLQKSSL